MSFKESYLEDRQRKIETLKNVVEDYEDDINMFDIIDEEDMWILYGAMLVPDKVFGEKYDIMPVVERVIRRFGEAFKKDDPEEFEKERELILKEFERIEKTE